MAVEKKYFIIFPVLILIFFLSSYISFVLHFGMPAKNSEKEVVPQDAIDNNWHKFSGGGCRKEDPFCH
jgi:hypothetical protein